jgi:hypothetical protein
LLKMILGLIFSILSVTYTIVSSNSVEASGAVSEGVEATYQRSGTTGQKGQMTAGNSTMLCVAGMDGCVIDSVVLQMRSNKSAGAGSLQMMIGESEVWTIDDTDFAHVDWNGEFSSEWVDIVGRINHRVEKNATLQIYIEASKNSLYINSYTIFYSLPEPECYDVSFVSGIYNNPNTLSEEMVGTGVLLPSCPDTLQWRFLGWSEQELIDSDKCPVLFEPGQRYYPSEDCTLWAVYSDSEEIWQTVDYQSGDYAVVNPTFNRAMVGGVKGDAICTIPVSLWQEDDVCQLLSGIEDNMVYHIDFMNDSTLTIRHKKTDTAVGYTDKRLSDEDAQWRYRVLSDNSLCVYYDYSKKQGMLYFGFGVDASSDEMIVYVDMLYASLMNEGGLLLFPYYPMRFTTWPFGKINGGESVLVGPEYNSAETYDFWFGNYVLRVSKGKKELIICK